MLGVDPYAIAEIAGHSNLKTQQRYVHYAKVMLSGGAGKVRREMLAYLCPTADEELIDMVFPESNLWFGHAQAASGVPILDILFGGLLYDPEFRAVNMRYKFSRTLNIN